MKNKDGKHVKAVKHTYLAEDGEYYTDWTWYEKAITYKCMECQMKRHNGAGQVSWHAIDTCEKETCRLFPFRMDGKGAWYPDDYEGEMK